MSRRTIVTFASAALVSTSLGWLGCSSSTTPAGGGNGDASTSSSSSGSSSGGSSGGSSGSSGGSSSGGSSGSSSGGGPSDAAATEGGITGCPSNACPASQTCCADLTTDLSYCADSCPSADTIACEGPSDCSGTTPDCCATDQLDGMDAGESFPHCYTESLTTSCVAKCVSNIQVTCTSKETLHVCAATTDCAGDTANPNCCLVAGYHVCVSSLLKTLGALTCL
jgi:hypothetical protein